MSRPILMSIRPEYADKILDGSKTVEFRKRPIREGTQVLIYRSGAPHQRGLVGCFAAGSVISETPARHLMTRFLPGINLDALIAYAGGPAERIWRIEIRDLRALPETLPLARLGITHPPQSWRYAPDDWAQRLGGEAP